MELNDPNRPRLAGQRPIKVAENHEPEQVRVQSEYPVPRPHAGKKSKRTSARKWVRP